MATLKHPLFYRCSYVKCKTGLPGVVIPVVSLRAMNAPPYMPRGHAVLKELRLCESCFVSADVHMIIGDKRWKDICEKISLQGGPKVQPPDRDTLELHASWEKDNPPPQFV